MAFVHHTMLTAENLRGLPSKQLHTIEPHFSHVRERPPGPSMVGWGGWSVFIRFGPVIGLHFFAHIPDFVTGRIQKSL